MKIKKKQFFILESLIVIFVITLMGWKIIPKFLDAQNINTSDNFPDPNFRAAVETYMGVEPGGVFTKTQAAEQSGNLYFDNMGVSNVKGLEYLKNVTQINASNNSLTTIDLQFQSHVKRLNIYHNRLTSLDVSNCEKLEILMCNRNQIKELILPNSNQLNTLIVARNQIHALDISNNPNLVDLLCAENQLSSLDVSKNLHLHTLDCMKNQLSKIDLSNNPELSTLIINENLLTQFPSLSTNKKLNTISISNNLLDCKSLTSIKLFISTFTQKQSISFHYKYQKYINLDDCKNGTSEQR